MGLIYKTEKINLVHTFWSKGQVLSKFEQNLSSSFCASFYSTFFGSENLISIKNKHRFFSLCCLFIHSYSSLQFDSRCLAYRGGSARVIKNVSHHNSHQMPSSFFLQPPLIFTSLKSTTSKKYSVFLRNKFELHPRNTILGKLE